MLSPQVRWSYVVSLRASSRCALPVGAFTVNRKYVVGMVSPEGSEPRGGAMTWRR